MWCATISALAATTTTTTLSISSGGSVVSTAPWKTPVTLTATVTTTSSAVTVGRVDFCDASALYCSDIHRLGSAQLTPAGIASITLFATPGNHSYRAVFLGTGTNSASTSASVPLTISGKLPTTTSISQSGSVNAYALTATVVGLGNLTVAPTGSVSFLDTTNANQVLATTNVGSSTAALTFRQTADSALGIPFSTACVTGDFNNDGIIDIALPNPSSNTIVVLLGKGDGTFSAPSTIQTETNPVAMAVGDFNGDGKSDLAFVNSGSNTVSILDGNGDGTFAPSHDITLASGPVAIAVGDFNGDGIEDLAVVTASFGDSIQILLGNGDSTFTAVPGSYSAGRGAGVWVGDFNNDGKADLLTVSTGNTGATFYFGNGDGTFTAGPPSNGTNVEEADSVVIADFNGDGFEDLAVSEYDSTIKVYLGNGDGTFKAAPTLTLPNPQSHISVADFNGDGKADLIANDTGSVYLLLGNGDGTFTTQVAQAGPNRNYAAVADLDGDGVPDIILQSSTPNNIDGLLTQSVQTVTAVSNNIAVSGKGSHAVVASYAGDSNYMASVSSSTSLTAITATTLTLGITPSASTYLGQQISLTATLAPASAQGQTSDNETITFYGNGVAVGTAKLASGTAVLNLTPAQAGQYSFSATYSGDVALAQSTSNTLSFLINPAPAVTASFGTPSVTMAQTGTAQESLTLTPSSGYSGTLQFQCSNLPQNATCTFQPATLTFSGNNTPATVSITLQTGVARSSASLVTQPGLRSSRIYPALTALCIPWFLAGLGFRNRRRLRSVNGRLLSACLAAAILSMSITGCSGSSSATQNDSRTPAGTYTIQLVVSGSNGLSQNVPLNITVQ